MDKTRRNKERQGKKIIFQLRNILEQTEWIKPAVNEITEGEIHFSRSAVPDFAIAFAKALY